jgi:hypothetical protein
MLREMLNVGSGNKIGWINAEKRNMKQILP